jgi:hypothetical protein
MTREVDALECPHCAALDLELGGDTQLKAGTPDAQLFVVCRSCRSTGPFAPTPVGAVEEWNRRTPRGAPIQYTSLRVDVVAPAKS